MLDLFSTSLTHLDCALTPVMVKMDPPKLVPPGANFLINKDPSTPRTYFTAKYGLRPAEKFGSQHTDEKT